VADRPDGQPQRDALAATTAWITARPWLAAPAAVLLLGTLAMRLLLSRWRRRRLHHRPQLVTITPPPEVTTDGALTWWATLGELLQPARWRRLMYGMPHVAYEYRWTGRQLTIGVWLPGTVPAGPVAAAARGAWPGATTTITPATAPLPVDAVSEGGMLAPALPAWYRLRTDHDADPLRPLISELSGLADHEHACVQLLTRPATPRQVRRLRRGTGTLRTGAPPTSLLDPTSWTRGLLNLLTPGPARRHRNGPVPVSHAVGWDPQRDRDARAAVDKLTDAPPWHTTIRYAVAHTNPRGMPAKQLRRRLRTLAHATAAAYGIYTARQHLRPRPLPHPAEALAGRVLHGGYLLGTGELAALAALPRDVAVPGLTRARAKPMPAPVDIPTGGRGLKVLGRALVGGHSVALPAADARQHLHVLGATGVGKSTFLANLILDDIAAGRGVVVIDPKDDMRSG
jgi:hypothetical protein